MEIFEIKNYGNVVINLKNILASRNMTKNKLATKMQTSYDLINRYYNNEVLRVDLDIIAKMCFILECDISDLLKYHIS